MRKTFVIAECAGTHDGQLGAAQLLIEMAAKAGADAVKFQYLSSAQRLVERRNAPEYLRAYETIRHPHTWHTVLKSTCERFKVEYMTTVYLPEDVQFVDPYVKRWKVASFEAGDQYLIEEMRLTGKPIIVSLGMGAEITPELDALPDVNFLHCVSAYPTPYSQINLENVRLLDGLSDHTKHPYTGAFAVAAGARIIEFHMRLNATKESNADYLVAKTPAEAKVYIDNIRLAEEMMGEVTNKAQACEQDMLRFRVRS